LAVRIRLTRVGATKRPSYRVVAIDRRRARDGRALEILGFYDPLTDPATVNLDTEKIKAWIGKGAQPSETVVKLMRQAENVTKPAPRAAATPRAKPAAPKRRAQARPAAAARAASAAPAAEPATTATADEPPAAEQAEAEAPAAVQGETAEPETAKEEA